MKEHELSKLKAV